MRIGHEIAKALGLGHGVTRVELTFTASDATAVVHTIDLNASRANGEQIVEVVKRYRLVEADEPKQAERG